MIKERSTHEARPKVAFHDTVVHLLGHQTQLHPSACLLHFIPRTAQARNVRCARRMDCSDYGTDVLAGLENLGEFGYAGGRGFLILVVRASHINVFRAFQSVRELVGYLCDRDVSEELVRQRHNKSERFHCYDLA